MCSAGGVKEHELLAEPGRIRSRGVGVELTCRLRGGDS